MKKLVTLLMLLLPFCLNAQVDRKEVREGRRKYAKGDFKEAELDFRKAVVKDSLSVPGQYDLASALYRQQNFDEAAKALDCIKEVAPASPHAAACHYNAGDIALAKKDYAAAAKAFREALFSQGKECPRQSAPEPRTRLQSAPPFLLRARLL